MVTSTTYYVIPDHHPFHNYTKSNTFTLQHYLNNASKYFVSYNQLHFLPGQYYINTDLVFKDIHNFTLTSHGINHSLITCTSPASILVINVDSFTMQNITLIDCKGLLKGSPNDFYVSVVFHYCNSVTMQNVFLNVSCNATATLVGIYVSNIVESKIINVQVKMNILMCHNHPFLINGLIVFYNRSAKFRSPGVIIETFNYYVQKSCLKYSQCAIRCKILTGPFGVIINNTVFADLCNSSALYYYGNENSANNQRIPPLLIRNVTVMHNTGFGILKMFYIVIYDFEAFSNTLKKNEFTGKFTDVYGFLNCSFVENTNIEFMIYVEPLSYSRSNHIYIKIYNSTFQNNVNVCFLKVTEYYGYIPNIVANVALTNLTISYNNQHYYGNDLILITNARVLFSNNVFIDNYYEYNSVIKLHYSRIYFKRKNRIIKNKARYIIKAQTRSIFYLYSFATVIIVGNVVYKAVIQENTIEHPEVHICPLQVFSNIEFANIDAINCKFLLLNNTEMISKSLPDQFLPFININCKWYFERMISKNFNVSDVYHKIIQYNNTYINKTSKRFIPASVCPCSQNGSYNCYDSNLGSVFPGQTLHIQLIIPRHWSTSSSTIIVANTKDDDCSIVDSYQLSQSHPTSHSCNNYSYTIWPNSRHTTECKLFIGLSEMPEMFYIQIKPCPVGFTLQSDKKSCYCDSLLINSDILSITSCNLDDETILRPANSWISADTNNSSYTYNVSPQCPFDYCLPHSSNLNLINPDSQCQFKRSGVLCGECQQGLSAVFGSSQCKHCSNLYLLIIIPIVIAGIVLVIMLFTFNLTVTNGIINTLIFYVNIININYSQFCFNSNSPDCTLLSLLNLDLGIETCFYDGMDGYAKMWLQLAFPSYLMLIAFALIIGSRYSPKLQSLTANRVLKVLATLFLLSYTKVLLTVCQVLFFFLSVTNLPSKHITLLWSISTSVAPFGAKFCIFYSICLILFIILLIFNVLLLFPRIASRWSFINYFKPLLDAFFGPYKERYPFWTGLQLLIRSSFFGLSALNRNVSLCSGVFLVGILLGAHGILRPFKSRYKNFQELLVLLDLLGLYVTALYSDNENNRYKMLVTRLLIITVLAYFIGLIFCHCVTLKCGDVIKQKSIKIKRIFTKMVRINQATSRTLHMEQLHTKIPDVTFNYKEYQEPLVALN